MNKLIQFSLYEIMNTSLNQMNYIRVQTIGSNEIIYGYFFSSLSFSPAFVQLNASTFTVNGISFTFYDRRECDLFGKKRICCCAWFFGIFTILIRKGLQVRFARRSYHTQPIFYGCGAEQQDKKACFRYEPCPFLNRTPKRYL